MKLPVLLFSFLLTITAANVVLAQNTPSQSPGRFNHMAFYVADLEVASTFYKDIFNLKEIPNPLNDGKHTWFELGPTSALHIISGAKTRGNYFIEEHICFSVPSIDSTIEKLKAKNIPFTNFQQEVGEITVRADNVRQIYFQDPDGHWLEVNDAKK